MSSLSMSFSCVHEKNVAITDTTASRSYKRTSDCYSLEVKNKNSAPLQSSHFSHMYIMFIAMTSKIGTGVASLSKLTVCMYHDNNWIGLLIIMILNSVVVKLNRHRRLCINVYFHSLLCFALGWEGVFD